MALLAAVKTLANKHTHMVLSFTREITLISAPHERWDIDLGSAVTVAELRAIAAAVLSLFDNIALSAL